MRFIHESHHFFALNRIFFPANEEATLKTKQPIRFQGLFKATDQTAGKLKIKSIMCQILQLLSLKLLLFPPKNWMNLISDRLSATSIKYLTWSSPVFGRFQNECNKVVIEPRVVQFWSQIIPVISNHAYDFSPNKIHGKITQLLSWFGKIKFPGNSVQRRVNSVQKSVNSVQKSVNSVRRN